MEIGAKSGWSFQQKHLREVVKTVKNCKNNKQAQNTSKTDSMKTTISKLRLSVYGWKEFSMTPNLAFKWIFHLN